MGKFSDLAKAIGKQYSKNTVIFRQGDKADAMFLIYSGAVEVKHEVRGRSAVLGDLGPGEFFGEMSLVDEKPRSATVTALEKSVVIPITAAFLKANILKDPRFIFQIIETLILRIDSTTRALDRMSTQGATVKTGDRDRREDAGDSRFDLLKFLKLFRGYADPGKYLQFEKGDAIFEEGEPGDLMFIILEGIVNITLEISGKRRVVASLERGDFFGESALITDLPRTASTMAATAVTLLPVVRKDLVDGLMSDPEAALQLVRILIVRLRGSIENYELGIQH